MNCKSGEVEEGGVGLVAGDKAGDDDFPPYVSHISSTTPPWPSSATAVALPNYSSREQHPYGEGNAKLPYWFQQNSNILTQELSQARSMDHDQQDESN